MTARKPPDELHPPCGRKAKRTSLPCRIRVRGGGPCRVHGENGRTRSKRLARVALAEQLAASPRRSPGDVLLEALHLADTLSKRALSEVEAGAVTPRRLREVVDASARAGALARTVLSAQAEAIKTGSGNELLARQLGDALEQFMARLGLSGDTTAELVLVDVVEAVASASWMPLNAAAGQRLVRLAEDQVKLADDVFVSVFTALGLEREPWVRAAMAAAVRAGGRGEVPPAAPPPRSWWVTLARRACAELGLPDPLPVVELLPPVPRAALTDGRGT